MTDNSKPIANLCDKIIYQANQKACLDSIIQMVYLFSDIRISEYYNKDCLKFEYPKFQFNEEDKSNKIEKEETKQYCNKSNSKTFKSQFDFASICKEFDDKEESQINSKFKVEFASITIIPKITDSDFLFLPQIEFLARMTEDQLSQVENVVIGNYHGYIQFLEPVDLRELDVCESVKISQFNLTTSDKLDKYKARVVLHDISKDHLSDKNSKQKNAKIVIKTLKKMYKMQKSSYDENSHSFWFITESLKIVNN